MDTEMMPRSSLKYGTYCSDCMLQAISLTDRHMGSCRTHFLNINCEYAETAVEHKPIIFGHLL